MTKIVAEFFLPSERAADIRRLHVQAAKHVANERLSKAAMLLLAAQGLARLERIDRQRAEMAAYLLRGDIS